MKWNTVLTCLFFFLVYRKRAEVDLRKKNQIFKFLNVHTFECAGQIVDFKQALGGTLYMWSEF